MKYTNINILDGSKRFKYIIEYQDNAEFNSSTEKELNYSVHTLNDDLRIDFFDKNHKYVRNDNYWMEWNEDRVVKGEHLDNLTEYIPAKYNVSSVNLYFPTNSVESFTNNNLYALTINTWIHGHTIYLGTYIIDRRDSIACKKQRIFLNSRYYEYVNVQFIDPWYLTYSDDWREFRQRICNEEEEDGLELNNTGSVLNFTLYPITWNEDKYIKLDPYIGGQNAINMSDVVSDYIGCDIELIDYYTGDQIDTFEKAVKASIRFNKIYNTAGVQTFNDLIQYLKETYDLDGSISLVYNLLVIDKENLYKIITIPTNELQYVFLKEDKQDSSKKYIYFDNWDGWKEGLKFILNIDINETKKVDGEDVTENVMLLRSNTISITQDVMKYFVGENPINYVNLTSVDMNNYTVNAVNKIEKKIVQLERPSNTKANLIKPVYYKVNNLSSIIIHPAVTENICINLDAYKSSVSTFYLQVAGVNFVEIARNSAGVIFKIIGANINSDKGSGVYYILNQDKELVTSGKYTFES